jgi:hypothetical protein
MTVTHKGRLDYACRLAVRGGEQFDKILAIYDDWIADHYSGQDVVIPRLASLGSHERVEVCRQNLLSTRSHSENGQRVFRIQWSFPAEEDASLQRLHDVRVGQFDDNCEVEHRCIITPSAYVVAPPKLKNRSPSVIGAICRNHSTFVGPIQVRAVPCATEKSELDKLMSLLTNRHRTVPLVVLAPYAAGKPNIVKANQLAESLAAVATVIDMRDTDATRGLSEILGQPLSCFDGAARIYWPGFQVTDDRSEHPLFYADYNRAIPSIATRRIEKAIFDVAAFRFVSNPKFAELEQRAKGTRQVFQSAA